MIKANPFHDKARDDPRRLQVMALKDAPAAEKVQLLEEAISGPEHVHAWDKHLLSTILMGLETRSSPMS